MRDRNTGPAAGRPLTAIPLALLAAIALSTAAIPTRADSLAEGTIQLVRIRGGDDEALRGQLLESLGRALWRHGFPVARIEVEETGLPRIAPGDGRALDGWIALGRRTGATAIAIVRCQSAGSDLALGLWVISVPSRTGFVARATARRRDAGMALEGLVARAADGIGAAARAQKQERYEAARFRRNGGGVMLGLGVPLVGAPTIAGWVQASRMSEDESDGTLFLGSMGGLLLLGVGTAATVTFATLGTVLVVSGQRRMERYRPEPAVAFGLCPHFSGFSLLLDREGRWSGLGLRIAF